MTDATTLVACTSAADCAGGQACCYHEWERAGAHAALCQTSCNAGEEKLCATDAECALIHISQSARCKPAQAPLPTWLHACAPP